MSCSPGTSRSISPSGAAVPRYRHLCLCRELGLPGPRGLLLSHAQQQYRRGGDLYNGDNCRSCEVGHTQMVQNGKPCYCGRFGCADCYCSAKPLVKLTGGDLAEFFLRLEGGDRDARDLWQEYLNYLAQLIHNIHMLYDCKVVLGGQIGQRLDGYLDTLCAKLAAMDPFIQNADYVSVCKAKVESAAVGAAISFIGEYVSSI